MMDTLAKILVRLAENMDIVALLFEALDRGAPRDVVRRAIEATMIATSDAAMREELSNG